MNGSYHPAILEFHRRQCRQRLLAVQFRREFARRGWPEHFQAEGPKEGDTKWENGRQYVFRDHRWHRVDQTTESAGASSKTSRQQIPRQSSRSVSAEKFLEIRSQVTYRAPFLSEYSLDELQQMAAEGAQFRLSEDGTAGYILHGGELKNLFALHRGTGVGRAMIVDAIARGAEKLDCIGPGLARLYASFGFVAVGAVPWDDQYAPRNWDYEEWGRPDIFFMEYRGGTREPDEIRRNAEEKVYPPFEHPGYGQQESFSRRRYAMTPQRDGHSFSVEELKWHGMLEKDITEDFLSWLDQEWEDHLRWIAETKGPEAAERARTSKPDRNMFLTAALL